MFSLAFFTLPILLVKALLVQGQPLESRQLDLLGHDLDPDFDPIWKHIETTRVPVVCPDRNERVIFDTWDGELPAKYSLTECIYQGQKVVHHMDWDTETFIREDGSVPYQEIITYEGPRGIYGVTANILNGAENKRTTVQLKRNGKWTIVNYKRQAWNKKWKETTRFNARHAHKYSDVEDADDVEDAKDQKDAESAD